MILTLEDIYRDVLEVANKDQNSHYPPRTLTQHVNFATNALIDQCAKMYPTNNAVISILKPFLKQEELNVVNGKVSFPKGYREFLSMGVYVRDEKIGEKKITACTNTGYKTCETDIAQNDPSAPTVKQQELKALARTCRSNPVNQKTVTEWDIATGHKYKAPTIDNPICCIFEGDGITIAPYNVEQIVLRYVKNPKEYNYGYVELPDGTFQFSNTGTVQSEWEQTAREYLNKIMMYLYSTFARDTELNQANLQTLIRGFF